MITRYSSRCATLKGFLPDLLNGAMAYDRIAGYFNSSIIEVAGEALESMAPGTSVRIICNSELTPLDVLTARAARRAMYQEWRARLPANIPPEFRHRLERLYQFLSSGRMHVRVLPNERFGLIHGKAGVITRRDGRRVAFMGSANESRRAWEQNYEIVWADESQEGIDWVQEEFDALWRDLAAHELADAIVTDVQRVVQRVVIEDVDLWKEREEADPAAVAIELPVYQRADGLWAHQKYFVRLAFDLHQRSGARLLLADDVGLGKTVQLALAAKLMALWGGGRVLILAPKTLLKQWRDEIWQLLQLPSAVWTGDGWEDEQEVQHPAGGPEGLRHCPRRVGTVSTGLANRSPEARAALMALEYECVILDEAHRARRSNLGPTHRNEPAEPNELLSFLNDVAWRTRSLLLGTATPVQLDPIEAWDLLLALNTKNGTVFGSRYSNWVRRPRAGLDYVLRRQPPPAEVADVWEWMRDPLPPRWEDRAFNMLLWQLNAGDDLSLVGAETLDQLRPPDRARLRDLSRVFFERHNPYIRHIVRRTRAFLENTIDPQTHEPYLKPVRVRLFGDGETDALTLPTFLRDAYGEAEAFCDELKKRPGMRAAFLRTTLLRRVGSSMEAGRRTAMRMLGGGEDLTEEEDEDLEATALSALQPLSEAEQEHLERFRALLREGGQVDPKLQQAREILLHGVEDTGPWLVLGCILFSQYYDTARWFARQLSELLPDEPVALYAGSNASGMLRAGEWERVPRETIQKGVKDENIRLVIGTDAAWEGLNLQKIGSLINIDLPWNPTRLQQRKGRIQRIGQVRDEVYRVQHAIPGLGRRSRTRAVVRTLSSDHGYVRAAPRRTGGCVGPRGAAGGSEGPRAHQRSACRYPVRAAL